MIFPEIIDRVLVKQVLIKCNRKIIFAHNVWWQLHEK